MSLTWNRSLAIHCTHVSHALKSKSATRLTSRARSPYQKKGYCFILRTAMTRRSRSCPSLSSQHTERKSRRSANHGQLLESPRIPWTTPWNDSTRTLQNSLSLNPQLRCPQSLSRYPGLGRWMMRADLSFGMILRGGGIPWINMVASFEHRAGHMGYLQSSWLRQRRN